MKRILKTAGLILVGAVALSAAGCGGGEAQLLQTPPKAESLAIEMRADPTYIWMKSAAESFAAEFATEAVRSSKAENPVVSPVSVFMALAMASTCATEPTQSELSEVLDLPYTLVGSKVGEFYRGLNAEYQTDTGLLVSKLQITNSIWVDQSAPVKSECLDLLAQNYYCHSYSADFAKGNKNANKAVQNFLKEQTNGVIDQSFELSKETKAAIVNSLYLTDLWNAAGEELKLSEEPYRFTTASGESKQLKLLEGEYLSGKANETETFRYFYTETAHGYKLKFLVPKSGHSAKEIFTADNLSLVRTANYVTEDENYLYRTRCVFPVFETAFDEDVKTVLQNMGAQSLFDPAACKLGALTDESVALMGLRHVAKLGVGKKGIEGAAVTIAGVDTSPENEFLPKVPAYLTFAVDRDFCFVVTDEYDVTLFAGIVQNA